MTEANTTTGPAPVTFQEIHDFRKEIDAVIQKSQTLQKTIERNPGGREISLVVTKLQEAKMWAGKILEAIGSPFPKELADKAEHTTGEAPAQPDPNAGQQAAADQTANQAQTAA